MPHKANPKHYHELEKVVTLAEACRLTRRTYNTITYAIDTGNIAAVQCGRNRLVHVDSLMDWFNRHNPNS